jgi:hypothetical protein
MARRDLSRTVIEGGRYYRNAWERRASHGVGRARVRAWLASGDDGAPRPPPRVRKLFRDKLGPAQRWLDAQVGRPWSKVFSELCARFDTRTVAGRHVIHDHLLKSVWLGDDLTSAPRHDFFVDAHGILRRDPFHGQWRKLRAEAAALANGRRAAKTFRGWYWHRRVLSSPCAVRGRCPEKQHVYANGYVYHRVRYVPDAPITRAELRRLERLPQHLRDDIVLNALPGTPRGR